MSYRCSNFILFFLNKNACPQLAQLLDFQEKQKSWWKSPTHQVCRLLRVALWSLPGATPQASGPQTLCHRSPSFTGRGCSWFMGLSGLSSTSYARAVQTQNRQFPRKQKHEGWQTGPGDTQQWSGDPRTARGMQTVRAGLLLYAGPWTGESIWIKEDRGWR